MEIAALLRSGTSAAAAKRQLQTKDLSDFQLKQFNFIWNVAAESGGHLALALDRLTEVFRAQQRQFAELGIAFSSPKATANLILLLPLLAVAFSELLGLSAIGASLGSALGVISIGLGLILLIVARISSLRMLEKARPREADPGAFLDAVVIGLSAGLSPKAAASLARAKSKEQFLQDVPPDQLTIFWDAVKVSEQSGIALVGLLMARADTLRHRLWSSHRSSLAKLSISLLIPLGLAALPAFVFLAVVPVGIGLFRSI
jgi:tight adherence protein B